MALTVWENVTVTGQYAGLVASSWKGQTYLRSAPAKVNNNSPKQILHKRLYKILYEIFQPAYKDGIKPFFNPPKMTPMNAIIKVQNPSYWKGNPDNWNSFYNTLTALNFPISELSFSMNAFYTPTSEDFKYISFENATFSGADVENIKKYHYIGYDHYNEKTFYTSGNFSEMPQKFTTALNTSRAYTGFLWFTTENKATGLYKTGIENGQRKYIL